MVLVTGVFPDSLNIPLFKTGEPENVSNCRPISVFPCFSKILERIMYNRLYKYLIEQKIFYQKQFGFQAHSTDHAVVKLADQIDESFEDGNYIFKCFYRSIQSFRHC